MTLTIAKTWDENERVTEASNGRLYTSAGRWQWVVIIDGEADRSYDTRREAAARITHLRMAAQESHDAPI